MNGNLLEILALIDQYTMPDDSRVRLKVELLMLLRAQERHPLSNMGVILRVGQAIAESAGEVFRMSDFDADEHAALLAAGRAIEAAHGIK